MLRVSFDFDVTSEIVTNVKVVDIPSKYDTISIPIVELGNNKLIVSPKAISLMSVNYGDRIAVNYMQESNELTFPVIGKAEVFADPAAGSKLSKINTISFKGIQRTMLARYGQLFKIGEYKPGMFKMTPINESDLAQTDPNLIDETNDLNLI